MAATATISGSSLDKAQQNGVVIGLKDEAPNTAIERLDIDVLLTQEPDTFNLFLLALAKVQEDGTDKMSFKQIAGELSWRLQCEPSESQLIY